MAKTQTQMIAKAREWADAVESSRWTDPVILDIMSDVADQQWRNLLNSKQSLRLATNVTVTSDANGRYALADFNTGSGNTAIRLYRIHGFVVDDIPYSESEFTKHPIAEVNNARLHVYWREGDNVFALPEQATKAAVVTYSHIPVRIEDLAAPSDNIVWPEGYETIIALFTAAEMLLKGGAEPEAAADLLVLAERKKEEMLMDLGRLSTEARRMQFTDDARDWGGQ